MKVLHVVASIDPQFGGVSQALTTMVDELQKKNVQNVILSLDSSAFSYYVNKDIDIYCFGPTIGPWKYTPKLFPWLINRLLEFDAVIVHGLWLYHTYAVRKTYSVLKKKKLHIPSLFVMPHGMLDPWFQRSKGRKLKALRNLAFWELIENQIINQSDCLLFTSNTEMLLARQTFNSYFPKLEKVVGIGVQPPPEYLLEMSKAFYTECNGVFNKPFILFLGRIDIKKGVDVLLNAYSNLTLSGVVLPNLVIAGPGFDISYLMEIKNFVEKNEFLKEKVYFPGLLTGEAKWGAFYLAEAFILPSHQENFGIAVVEALACGIPVLISYQINIWHDIKSDGSGLVYDDTVYGVEKMLYEWSRMSEKDKKQMKISARASYERYFTASSAVENLLNLLHN